MDEKSLRSQQNLLTTVSLEEHVQKINFAAFLCHVGLKRENIKREKTSKGKKWRYYDCDENSAQVIKVYIGNNL